MYNMKLRRTLFLAIIIQHVDYKLNDNKGTETQKAFYDKISLDPFGVITSEHIQVFLFNSPWRHKQGDELIVSILSSLTWKCEIYCPFISYPVRKQYQLDHSTADVM